MYVTQLELRDFRNIRATTIEFSERVNILTGGNAQGKTSVLEALYFCAYGRSHRTMHDREMINLEADSGAITAQIDTMGRLDRIAVDFKKNAPKRITVNGIQTAKLSELYGFLYAVLFAPEDLELIKQGPALRRRFMDMELCRLDFSYYFELSRYFRVLKQRNTLLKTIAQSNDKKLEQSLDIWDEALIKHGAYIYNARQKYVKAINESAKAIHARLTGDTERLDITYEPNTTKLNERMSQNRARDIATNTTNAGIHKDDIAIHINGRDARLYASQGQQRTASLSLKLAQLDMIERGKAQSPVLLLDDVLSELDSSRQAFLLEYVSNMQTIITATGMDNELKRIMGAARCFNVQNGEIRIKG